MTRRRRREKIPAEQAAIVGANIRALRQRRGWTQPEVGELMGWLAPSSVCAAEGRRADRQRGFTTEEVERLAGIFGVSPTQLMTRCATCAGHPPAGFACLTCGAMPGGDRPDVLRYAAGICAAGYEPGTAARGLLEQLAADDMR